VISRRPRTARVWSVSLATFLTVALSSTMLVAATHPAEAANAPSGTCPWMNATLAPATRTSTLLRAMSLDDKVQLVTGIGQYGLGDEKDNVNPAAGGVIAANPALCIPALVMNDAGAGMGDYQKHVTAFPDSIGQTATWDPTLITRYGRTLGSEAFAKGANVVLAPGVDIARNPLNGRNFEYAGEDPYLAGRTAAAVVTGIQSQHEIATVKHYALNDQETNRHTDSSDADERTMEEIHLPAFEAAVKAGVGSVMCSYNRVNGVYACENSTLLTTYLKGQFAFQGFVMSDWLATHSTVGSANAGLDMEMPGGVLGSGRYFGPALAAAVNNHTVPVSRVNDMARRILLEMFTHGLFDHVPAEGGVAAAANASTPASVAVATQLAQNGSVLLKNSGNVLPLTGKSQRIAVIGSAAGSTGATQASQGYGSGHVPLIGYQPNVSSPLDAIRARAVANGTAVTYNDGSSAVAAAAAAKSADTAVVFVTDVTVEGVDKPDLNARAGTCIAVPLSYCFYSSVDQNALVSAVARANPNTLVVVQSGGPIAMPWLGSVRGVVENWLPGQVDGAALAPLLFGDVNFSGKLPVTFPTQLSDGPLQTAAQYPGVTDANGVPHSTYSEGLLVGYRWYTAQHIQPMFPFGFGLSYTKYRYSRLSVTPTRTGATATVTITNTGSRAGAEIAQLYVTDPAAGEPPIQLKGFRKVALRPGQSRTVTMQLDQRAFSVWKTSTHAWYVTPGCYQISVGGSSANLPLHAALPRAGGRC
jgi:beta-glucosidase